MVTGLLGQERKGDGREDKILELHQDAVLVRLVLTVHVDLLDALHGQLVPLQGDLCRPRCKVGCVTQDLVE